MVYEQAETGRKLLNLSPWFLLGIAGLPEEESDALLHEIMEYATDPHFAYWHAWQMGDLVLTTIAGDYGLGRLEGERAMDVGSIVHV